MTVREPAVAGLFYPVDPRELAATIDTLLANARRPHVAVRALVVPHAGYIYSGPIAATAYATLLPRRDDIRRVVLLGPSHRVPLDGLAVPSVDAFRTPLGDVPIDESARVLPPNDRAHAHEHSLEVQVPFLQRVLRDFTLVPIVVGRCETAIVAGTLETLWGGPETIVVISTDLSHYENYVSAAAHDRTTADAIVACASSAIGPHDACGAYPLRGLLELARARNLIPTLLDLRSSGDTAGDHDRVVGYGAFAIS